MNNTITIRPTSRDQWLEIRSQGIGSSEIGTILGLNPFDTPYQLWRRKRGIDPPIEENFAMKAGHYLEDAVAQFYADATGHTIIKNSATDYIIRDAECHFMQVSPDRTFWLPNRPHNERNKGILECKTTQHQIDATSIPDHWFCQIQYQLGVAGYQEGAIAWLTQGREFGWTRVTFDPVFFDMLADQARCFWEKNIVGGEEPPCMNTDDLKLRFPRHTSGKAVEADAELAAKVEELKQVRATLNILDKRKQSLEETIKLSLGDAEVLIMQGETIATWKAAKDVERFDSSRFKAENTDLYNKYIYTTPAGRRLLIK